MSKLSIKRERAIDLLKSMPNGDFEMSHYLESEAIMKGVAKKLGEDEEYWGMLGLLHDVDWGLTKENPEKHLTLAPEILRKEGFDENFIGDIISHGYGFDILPHLKDKKRDKKIQHALAASETLTGLIYAYALMRGKKISDMSVKGLKKKFKDKAFAANCNREVIKEIEKTGLTLEDFFEIAIESIKNIKSEIGLY